MLIRKQLKGDGGHWHGAPQRVTVRKPKAAGPCPLPRASTRSTHPAYRSTSGTTVPPRKGRSFASLLDQNDHLREWTERTAELRIRGTTTKRVQCGPTAGANMTRTMKEQLLREPDDFRIRCTLKVASVEISGTFSAIPDFLPNQGGGDRARLLEGVFA